MISSLYHRLRKVIASCLTSFTPVHEADSGTFLVKHVKGPVVLCDRCHQGFALVSDTTHQNYWMHPIGEILKPGCSCHLVHDDPLTKSEHFKAAFRADIGMQLLAVMLAGLRVQILSNQYHAGQKLKVSAHQLDTDAYIRMFHRDSLRR